MTENSQSKTNKFTSNSDMLYGAILNQIKTSDRSDIELQHAVNHLEAVSLKNLTDIYLPKIACHDIQMNRDGPVVKVIAPNNKTLVLLFPFINLKKCFTHDQVLDIFKTFCKPENLPRIHIQSRANGSPGIVCIEFDEKIRAYSYYRQMSILTDKFTEMKFEGYNIPRRNLSHIWIPVLEPPEFDNFNPLICMINSRSGGGQGLQLLTQLENLLNPNQVIDLSIGGPEVGLLMCRKLKKFRILACGGDGTASWVIRQLLKISRTNLVTSSN